MSVLTAFRCSIDSARPGAENMELDVAALHAVAGGGAPHIRIYGFAPACLTLGRLQPADDADIEACGRDGVDVVRRPTGGMAILHDQEVTYSVACRTDDEHFGGDVLTACARIHEAIAIGLVHLGLDVTAVAAAADERGAARLRAASADCFARPSSHELLDANGNKLVGSAQARHRGALLQHGSVLLEPPRAGDYVNRASVAPATLGVRALAGRNVTFAELQSAIAWGFTTFLGERCTVA